MGKQSDFIGAMIVKTIKVIFHSFFGHPTFRLSTMMRDQMGITPKILVKNFINCKLTNQ
jgi:hypothetical protein